MSTQRRESGNPSELSSRFWVAASPFWSTTLMIGPSVNDEGNWARLQILDCDGVVANEAAIDFPRNQVGFIEVEPLMQGCKMQSGLIHGQAILTSALGSCHLCRYITKEEGGFSSAPLIIDQDWPGFLPLTIGAQRSNLVAFCNLEMRPSEVIVRLISGRRSPETVVVIPPLGSRLISVSEEFHELFEESGEGLAYLRVRGRTEGKIGVQLMENLDGVNARSVVRCIS